MNPIAIVLILVVIVVGVGAIIVIRRRQAANDDIPDLGDPMDYTSMPDDDDAEKKPGLKERLGAMPLPAKIALLAAPVVVILLIVITVVGMGLLGGSKSAAKPTQPAAQQPTATPEIPLPVITLNKVSLVNARSIQVKAETDMPDGTEVQIELLQGGEPFAWFNADDAKTVVERGRFEVRLDKMDNAPQATREISHVIRVSATIPDGRLVENSTELEVPQNFVNDFFAPAVVVDQPTPTPKLPDVLPPDEPPPDEPPPDSTEPTTPANQPTEPATPAVEFASDVVVHVANGGNVRIVPGGDVVDQVNAFEQVELLKKTPDAVWYQIRNERNNVGWVHHTLLNESELSSMAAKVVVEGDNAPATPATPDMTATTATTEPVDMVIGVLNGGNVRKVPGGNPIIDQINVGENVTLIEKTDDGEWYRVQNTRSVTGWVHSSLLVPEELEQVADKVPVATTTDQ